MTQALEGIRVLDLTSGIAGPLGVLTLAEHGADVIKVEPPGGWPDRNPAYNRSRRSVTIDLSSTEGQTAFKRLCETADVLVESFKPGTMERWGLDYESLQLGRLIYCSLPAWPKGSRFEQIPGYEALVHARTGQQWEITGFDPGPMFLRSPVASLTSAMLVPAGILSALLARERTGEGQQVEISLLQGILCLTTQMWCWTDQGQLSLPRSRPPGIHQRFMYECANGEWLQTSILSGGKPSRTEAEILGQEEGESTADAYRRQDRAELIDAMRAAGHAVEAVDPPHAKFTHPQLVGTGSVVDVGGTTQLGQVIFMERTQGQVRGPQPAAGEHNEELCPGL